VLAEFVTPLRQRVAGWLDDPAGLDAVLARGADRARSVAADTVRAVYARQALHFRLIFEAARRAGWLT